MSAQDGDGWTYCDLGHEHWGRHGAAGLLAHHRDPAGTVHILLQHRAWWSHNGGTWGLCGGARDSHEDSVTTALREAVEEAALDTAELHVDGIFRDDHGGWMYDTVIASAPRLLPVHAAARETNAVAWVPLDEVRRLPLHPGFAATWPSVRRALRRLVVVVDAANVVGARADGWWRDRAGATARMGRQLAGLATAGLPGSALPEELGAPYLDHWYPEIVLVVEGAAREVREVGGGVRVVAAAGSGDDAVVEGVRARGPDDLILVVTADRALRDRCRAAGAAVTGPTWLLDRIAPRPVAD